MAFVTLLDGQASYAFYDENTASRMMLPDDMPNTLSNDIEALFFRGISLVIERCASACIAFLNTNKVSRLLIPNPNTSPTFISDKMRYCARMSEVSAKCDILKITIEELDCICPKNQPRDKKALDNLKQRPGLLCLTLGSKGVKVYDKKGLRFTCPAPQISLEDTVGVGVALTAGLLVSLKWLNVLSRSAVLALSHNDLETAVRFATAFASDTATREGSDPVWNFIAP